jgi:hypothetical protein
MTGLRRSFLKQLSDVVMPKLSGPELAVQVNSVRPRSGTPAPRTTPRVWKEPLQ